ncbi:NAD-dependent epimerase/dehydratase [Actinosynnema sp. NPDC023587]|uniref:NAD-dependent epimerase/dehydratase n=1 Tax=Actinosynnema sp. NPDC023587 TaxID=3154695 RepID=UPI0033C93F97
MDLSTRPLIVVLGASGLLGTAVARELSARPVRLRLVGRRRATVPAGCRAQVEVRAADLADGVADAVADADAVVHLVARMTGPTSWRVADGDREAERITAGLARDLVAAVRAQRRERPPVVLFAGAVSQAGTALAGRLDGTERDEPVTAYDRHKLAAQHALEAATADGVLRAVTLRMTTLFGQGTGHDRGVVAAMVRRALAGRPLTMWHDGSVRRDLLCVDDAARAFTAALDSVDALAGRHWLVGTGRPVRIDALFGAIAAAVAERTGHPPVPVVSQPPDLPSLPTDLLDFDLDPTRFHAATGWRARVGLADGLRTAVAAEQRRTAAAAR